VQLVGETDGVKEFYRIGADIDPGTEFGEFRRLLVDLNFESLPAERDRRRQPAKPRSDNGNPTRVSHFMLRNLGHCLGANIVPAPARTLTGAKIGFATATQDAG
jgi:hypothetical protein